jgi:hypothetical protein
MGVEIDLRSSGDEIILAHDPFVNGELLKHWLTGWNGQFLVLNIKEEGLETRILEILSDFNVTEFFFLDQSFPFMMKSINSGDKRVAARVSDVEVINTAINSGAQWCWLDCFSGNWDYLIEAKESLASVNIKSCLVSPELQRIDFLNELKALQSLIELSGLKIDAVCTKNPEAWR